LSLLCHRPAAARATNPKVPRTIAITTTALLDNFKNDDVANEMYSIGWVLSYIFTGKQSLSSVGDEVSRIVQKCAA